MSKLIKAEKRTIIDIKRILVPQVDKDALEDQPFSPFSVETPEGDQGEDITGQETRKEETDAQVEKSREDVSRGDEISDAPLSLAKEEAKRIVEQAKEEARQVREEADNYLENARRRAEELESKAYNDGFLQGKKDGEELGKRQFEAMSNRLRSLIEALSQQGDTLFAKYETQIVRLALEIAKKVVQRELETSPEIVVDVVRRAAKEISEATSIKIMLNPKDLDIVKEYVLNDIELTGGHQIEFTAHSDLKRGGCIIETEFGLVDASLEGRWKAIEEAIEMELSKVNS